VLVPRGHTRPAHLVLSNSHLSFVVRTGRSLHHQEGALANGRGVLRKGDNQGQGSARAELWVKCVETDKPGEGASYHVGIRVGLISVRQRKAWEVTAAC
jgi:hypothetical protein